MGTVSAFEYLLLAVISFGLVSLLTPVMRKVATRIDFFDAPNSPHKSHKAPVPYLGGVAIVLSVLITVFATGIFSDSRVDLDLALTIFIPASILGFVGLIDDKFSLAPFPRFLAQTAVGLFTALVVIGTNSSGNPFGNFWLDAIISTLWVVGISNSINFFDNVDGGASGTVAIVSAGIFCISLVSGQFLIAAVAIIIFGSTSGFLLWNKTPARIYMGDAGSLFLGFLISVLTIRLNPDVESKLLSFSVPLLLLAIPILDTSVAVTSRIRRGVSPFQGGHDHLSHRLMRRGLSKRKTVSFLWCLASCFVGMAALIALGTLENMAVLPAIFALWLLLFFSFMTIPGSEKEEKL